MMQTFILLAGLLSAFSANAQLSNESEVGLVVTSGNTDQSTYNIRQASTYQSDANVFKLGARYLKTISNDATTAFYWNLGLRYEREFSPNFSLFAAEVVESDRFAKLAQRYNTDAGAKYFFMKDDSVKWFAEAGYRYQLENRFDGSQVKNNQIRAYTEYDRILGPSISAKLWLEFLPNLTNTDDYQLNTEASLTALLTNVFSIKFAYLLRFDNVPAPGVGKKTDTVTTTSLVAKF